MRNKIILDEKTRMEELQKCRILDTAAEQTYDDIVKPASEIGETPIALVTLVDGKRLVPDSRKTRCRLKFPAKKNSDFIKFGRQSNFITSVGILKLGGVDSGGRKHRN